MEKLGGKLEKLLIITETTGAVCAGFKYLLPLVIPLPVDYILVLVLRLSARFLPYRMKITAGGKRHHMPIGVIDGAEFLAVLSTLGVVLYRNVLKLCSKGKLLMVQPPVWLEQLDLWPTGNCHKAEHAMGLRLECVAGMAGGMLYRMVDTCKTAAIPFLMADSMFVLSCLTKAATASLVMFLATILSPQEVEDLRDRRDQSVFRKEFNMIGNRLVRTGKAQFESQGTILFTTTRLCIGGVLPIHNPCYIMAGIRIGILDTLPISGTDMVSTPWAVLRLTAGDWKQTLAFTAPYLVCYFMRQILEVWMMGGQVRPSLLKTLAPVYMGLELFGFFGFILRPLGLLLTRDMVEARAKEIEREMQRERRRGRGIERRGLSERLGLACHRVSIRRFCG